MPTSNSLRDDTLKHWPHLIACGERLGQRGDTLRPLKDTITRLADCIETQEDVLNGEKEYHILRDRLEDIFETLGQYYGRDASLTITGSVETLCKDIDREIQDIKDGPNQGRLEGSPEASRSLNTVLRRYDRIRDYLRRVSLNENVSLWKISDAEGDGLDCLRPALSAYYNSARATELKRSSRIEDAEIDALSKMVDWVGPSSQGSVYWMSGLNRTRKTAIAYSLCHNLADSGNLAASFFCSRLLPESRDMNRIIPSIAYQLAHFSRPFHSALLGVLEKNPDVHTRLSHLQFDALIIQNLNRVKDTLPDNLVVVIDALDECEAKEGTSRILDVLLMKPESLPVKFVVSSPPEPEIWDRMTEQSDQEKSRVVLRELDSHTVLLEFIPENPEV